MFDYDRFSRNDVVGEVRMNMDEFDVVSSVEVWGEITKNKKVLLLAFMCYATALESKSYTVCATNISLNSCFIYLPYYKILPCISWQVTMRTNFCDGAFQPILVHSQKKKN